MPPLERCIERVATRSGHGFTDLDATRHMYDQFALRSENVESRHFIRDLPDEVAPLVDLIVELVEAGSLRYVGHR